MKPVLHSFAYSLDFLREQVADVAAPDLVAQPAGMVNHPVWTIGHLIFICQLLGGVVGLSEWLPVDWEKRFGSGSIPVSDGSLYENKDNLLALLGEAQQKITLVVEQLDDSVLNKPFPDETYLDVFPSIRHAFTQVLTAHTAFHIGQVSVWRRLMGLPAMQRSFE
jgi:DinB superfamily